MKKLYLFLTAAALVLLNVEVMAQVPSYVPTSGLVGWWPFNGNANDESGNGNNGTVNGGVSDTSDRFGNSNSAFYFNGTDGYISIPSLNNLPYTPVTYSAWVIVSSYFPNSFGHKFKTVIGRNTAFVCDNGAIGFWADGAINGGLNDNTFLMWRGCGVSGAIPNSDSIPVLHTWIHIVYTQQASGDWKWYHNGILTNSGNFTDLQRDFNYFEIGGCNNNSQGPNFWDNKLDDIGLWNRVLTQQEITDLYNGCQLTVNMQPNSQTININSNAQFIVGASDSNATYQWQIDLGTGFVNVSNAGQFNGATNDTLTVSNVTPSNNNQRFRCIVTSGACTDTSNSAILSISTGINSVQNQSSILLFPNPASNQIVVKLSGEGSDKDFQIFNKNGQIVETGRLSNTETTISVSNIPNGVYVIKCGENKKHFIVHHD